MLDDLAFSVGKSKFPAAMLDNPSDGRPTPPRSASRPSPRPPGGRPGARPVMIGAPRQSSCQASIPFPSCDGGSSSVLDAESEEDPVKLRRLNAELLARCNWQASELKDLRKKVDEANGRSPWQSQESPRRPIATPAAPRVSESKSQGAQTDEVSVDDRLDIQNQQLDAVHALVGEKVREIGRLREHIKTVEGQVKQQSVLAEQYRTELESVEAQMKNSTQKQHRAEDERSLAEWKLRSVTTPRASGRAKTPQDVIQARAANAWTGPQPACSTPRGTGRSNSAGPRGISENSTTASSLDSSAAQFPSCWGPGGVPRPPSSKGERRASTPKAVGRPSSRGAVQRTESPESPKGPGGTSARGLPKMCGSSLLLDLEASDSSDDDGEDLQPLQRPARLGGSRCGMRP